MNPSLPAIPPRALVIMTMGVFAVSLSAILIKLAQADGVPSVIIAASRLLLATLFLTPFVLTRYRADLRAMTRRQLGLALVAGVFLAAHFYTWISSIEFTSVLISVVLVNTAPLWVALLERVFLKAALKRAVLVGLAIVLTGSVLIGLPSGEASVQDNDSLLTGGALALAGAATVAVYMVIGRGMRLALPLPPYLWVVYGSAALTLCVIIVFQGASFTGYPPSAYLWLLGMGVFPQLIGHSSLNYAMRFLPATLVSISTQLEPILSALMAFFIFQQVPTETQFAGSVVVFSGVLVATLGTMFGRSSGS